MRHFKIGLESSLGLLLLACGGTVDLNTPGDGTGGTSSGVGGTGGTGTGGVGMGGTGGLGTGGLGTGGLGTGGLGTGGTGGLGTGGVGEPVPGVPPSTGTLAYDADSDALGRAVYLRSFEQDDCVQRLTDPQDQAKQPAFSADGGLLAYAALVDGLYQIHVRDLANGDVKKVTDQPLGATSPAFSPDGSRVAFVTADPEVSDNRGPGEGNLMLVELDTLDVTLVADAESQGCCVQQYLSPVFNGADEILVGTRTSLVGIDLVNGAVRDVVPITGRIPNPQDPSIAPDGVRYVFSDFCGVGLGLYVARVDGSTGDTCANAQPIATGHRMVSADWGDGGYIAAEIDEAGRGVLFADDTDFSVSALDAPGARNPEWAPSAAEVPITCE